VCAQALSASLSGSAWLLGLRDHWRTLTSRMKIRPDVECHFVVAAYYRNGHALARSKKKRCVDNIIRLMDFPVSNLEQYVTRLNA